MTQMLSVSFNAFSSCGGCLNETWKSRLQNALKYQSVIEVNEFSTKKEIQTHDVAFVEGSIATSDDEKILRELRSKAKKMILLGGCAINGWPSTQRNHLEITEIKTEKKVVAFQLPKLRTPNEIIKVDAQLRGCPIDERQFDHLVNRLLVEFGVMKKGEK